MTPERLGDGSGWAGRYGGPAMQRTTRDISAYIDSLPDDVRGDIVAIDDTISHAMEGQPKHLWVGRFWGGSDQEIIGYGLQTNRRSDKTEVTWFVVGLAVQKNYLSVYINAVEDGQYLPERYGSDLGKVKVGKASIAFSGVDAIDLEKLGALVERARTLTEAAG